MFKLGKIGTREASFGLAFARRCHIATWSRFVVPGFSALSVLPPTHVGA